MSKFLKIIVNIVLVCALLSAAALLVPSLLGVEMNIIENDRVETNLSVGTVVYGQSKSLQDVEFGDNVFIEETDGSEYLYRVNAVDAENGTVVLKDARNDAAQTVEKTLSSVCVVFVTVPVLGYLAVAAGSVKGWVIIGLAAVLLLLLFILSEIWRKDKLQEEEEDDEDGDAEEMEQAREEKKKMKKEKKARKKAAKEARDEEEDEEYEAYLKKKEEKKAAQRARKAAKKEAKHLNEEPTTRAIEAEPEPVQNTADLFEAARAEIASSVASAMAEDQDPVGQNRTAAEPAINPEMALTQEVSGAAANEHETQTAGDAENEMAVASQETLQEDSQQIVIPCYSADELIRKAILAGDEPDIVEDRDLGLTLLDYSSIL